MKINTLYTHEDMEKINNKLKPYINREIKRYYITHHDDRECKPHNHMIIIVDNGINIEDIIKKSKMQYSRLNTNISISELKEYIYYTIRPNTQVNVI